MDQRAPTLRTLISSALVPANALLLSGACARRSLTDRDQGGGHIPTGGTAGTEAPDTAGRSGGMSSGSGGTGAAIKHALEIGGAEVAARLRDAISEDRPSLCPASSTPTRWIWNHYGRLTPEQEQAVLEETWRDVITPTLELLLGPATHIAATSGSRVAAST